MKAFRNLREHTLFININILDFHKSATKDWKNWYEPISYLSNALVELNTQSIEAFIIFGENEIEEYVGKFNTIHAKYLLDFDYFTTDQKFQDSDKTTEEQKLEQHKILYSKDPDDPINSQLSEIFERIKKYLNPYLLRR